MWISCHENTSSQSFTIRAGLRLWCLRLLRCWQGWGPKSFNEINWNPYLIKRYIQLTWHHQVFMILRVVSTWLFILHMLCWQTFLSLLTFGKISTPSTTVCWFHTNLNREKRVGLQMKWKSKNWDKQQDRQDFEENFMISSEIGWTFEQFIYLFFIFLFSFYSFLCALHFFTS